MIPRMLDQMKATLPCSLLGFFVFWDDDATIVVMVSVQQMLLLKLTTTFVTVAETKDEVANIINVKKPIASADFLLKVSGRAELGTFVLHGNSELRVTMEFRIRGVAKWPN